MKNFFIPQKTEISKNIYLEKGISEICPYFQFFIFHKRDLDQPKQKKQKSQKYFIFLLKKEIPKMFVIPLKQKSVNFMEQLGPTK